MQLRRKTSYSLTFPPGRVAARWVTLASHLWSELRVLGCLLAAMSATRLTSLGSSNRSDMAAKLGPGPRQRISFGDLILGSFVRRVARFRNNSASLKLFWRVSARRSAPRTLTFQSRPDLGIASRCAYEPITAPADFSPQPA